MTDPRGPAWRKTHSGHPCNWPGCHAPVGGRLWACKEHWLKIPIEMRDRYMEAGSKWSLNKGPIQSSPLVQLVSSEILSWVESNYGY